MKEENPDANLWDFSLSKAKENIESFIGGAMAGAYTSGTTQLSAKALEYSYEKFGGAPEDGTQDNAYLNPVHVDIAQSYDDGYTMDDAQEMNDAKNTYELRRENMARNLGVEPEEVDNAIGEPMEYVNKLMANGMTEDVQDVLSYVNAKATYEGMKRRVADDVQSAIEQSDELIRKRTNNTTGMIHPVTLKALDENGNDKQAYLVSGNVVMMDDGSMIDKEKSDQDIIISDAYGNLEFTTSDRILRMDDTIDADEEREAATETIRQQFEQAAQAKMSGTVTTFNEGDTHVLTEDDGRQLTVKLVPDEKTGLVENADGTVNMTTDGQNIVAVPKEELQRLVDNTNRAKIVVYEQEKRQREAARMEAEAQAAAARPQYNLNDTIVIRLEDGAEVEADVFQEENEDGAVGVVAKDGVTPIYEGRVSGMIPRDVLDGMNASVEISAPQNGTQGNGDQIDDVNEMVGHDMNVETNDETAGSEDIEPTENIPALARIEKDEKGEPLYEQADPELAWDALVESTEGDAETAKVIADSMVEDLKAELKKAEKLKVQGATPSEKLASAKLNKAAKEQIQSKLAGWQKIAGTEQRRKAAIDAENRRKAQEAAAALAEQRAAERAAQEEAERKEREALNGVPDWTQDIAKNARARGYRRVTGTKVDRQQPIVSLSDAIEGKAADGEGRTTALVGKPVTVKFDKNNMPEGNAVVIEASMLQPSHLQGQRNPAHFIDEAQPKERNDQASVHSAREIAENIRPEEITGSVTAYTGAPSVNARGEVIQGNNRSDALRYMWQNPQSEQAQQYKQYLKDHADEFGLKAEDIEQMESPVLVNMLDVDDETAIGLGQFVAQDTESGGIERIKPKNIAERMKGGSTHDNMQMFAKMLLDSQDEEDSLSQLVDKNGAKVLDWLNGRGFITPTQYQSAFDSKGNLTGEAVNDLKGILYQHIFQGGSTRLEEMFNSLPVKVQRAILATAFRDFDSKAEDRMIGEIQQSIMAYYEIERSDEGFASAKNLEEARMAVENWKRQYIFDDATGESVLPIDKYSNFALLLCSVYKGQTQRGIQALFNELYDVVQGAKEDNLFETFDKTPKPLAEAVKQVIGDLYNIDIEYNGHTGNVLLGGNSETGEEGRPGSDGSIASGEQPKSGAESPDSTGRTESDGLQDSSGGRVQEVHKGLSEEEADALIGLMESSAVEAASIELNPTNWASEFGETGIVSTPIGDVKMGENQIAKLFEKGRSEQFGMIRPTLQSPNVIIEVESKSDGNEERGTSLLFVKTFVGKNGKKVYYFKSVTVKKDGLEVSVSSHYDRPKRVKDALKKGKLLYRFDGGAQTEHRPADVSVTASPEGVQGIKRSKQQALLNGNNPHQYPDVREQNAFDSNALDNTTDTGETHEGNGNDTATPENTAVSDGKGTKLSGTEQEKGEEIGETASNNDAEEAARSDYESRLANLTDKELEREEAANRSDLKLKGLPESAKEAIKKDLELIKAEKGRRSQGTEDDNDLRFRFIGEKGAGNADRAEESSRRMDNLRVAEDMERKFEELKGSDEHKRMVEAAKKIRALESEEATENKNDDGSDKSREQLKADYVGHKAATNKETGVTVEFWGGAFKKNHRDGGLFEKAIPALKKVFENAVFAYSEKENLAGQVRPDGTVHKEHRSIKSFDNYVGKVKIGDKEYYVRFTVQMQPGQNGIHSQMVTNVDLYETENPTQVASYPALSAQARLDLDGMISTKVASYRDSSLPARLDFNEISDAKLQRFFDLASESEENFARRVKMATGWERGKDGKWRYEEPDMIGIAEGKKIVEALQSEDGRAVLGYVLGAEHELFKAYPQLSFLTIEKTKPGDTSDGRYNPQAERIELNIEKMADALGNADELTYENVAETMIHEIQHAIQDIEGFASGGNRWTFKTAMDGWREKALAWGWRNGLAAKNEEMPDASPMELQKALVEDYEALGYVPSEEIRSKGFNLWSRGYDGEGYETAFKNYRDNMEAEGLSDYEAYRRLAGETEARNASRRRDMSEDERRGSLASETEDVGRDEQIVVKDGGTNASASREEDMRGVVEGEAAKLHLGNVEFVADSSELKGRKARARGWYDPKTGKIVVVLPNHTSVQDVIRTMLHEGVAHFGLRKLFGEHFDTFLDNVYRNVTSDIREAIDSKAYALFMADGNKRSWDECLRVATEEYMADIAEDTDFERLENHKTFWQKVKNCFLNMLAKVGVNLGNKLTDNDLKYILWRSYQNMAHEGRYRNVFDVADDVVKDTQMRKKFNIGELGEEIAENRMLVAEGEAGYEDANRRFNEQLAKYESGQMPSNSFFELGNPVGVLSYFLPDMPVVMRQRVLRKGIDKKHNISLASLQNMPKQLSEPIFVFQRTEDTIGILTEMKDNDGKNVCVAIELNRSMQNGGNILEVNDIRSIHGRDSENVIQPIINNGTLRWVDKEKGLRWLSSASQQAQQEIVKEDLDSAAKIVENFENPKVSEGNEAEDGVLYRDGDPEVRERARAAYIYESRVKKGMYQMQEALQDSMLGLKEAMQAVLKASGSRIRYIEDVDGFENPYIGENRLSSVTHEDVETFKRTLFKELLDEVAKLAHTDSENRTLIEYMMAKHGLERNEFMARREAERSLANSDEKMELDAAESACSANPLDLMAKARLDAARMAYDTALAAATEECRKRDYAGLTALTGEDETAMAEGIAKMMVDDYEDAHDTRDLWGKVNAVNKATLSKLYECGLLTKENYEKIRDMYQWYIPLRGFDETTSADAYAYLNNGKGGFNAPIKKAEGRKSVADDPLAQMRSMAESAIMQGNRNVLVKQRMLNFALNHPSDLVSVSELWLKYDEIADEWNAVFPDNIEESDTPEEVEKKMADFEEKMKQLAETEPDKYKRGKDAVGIPYRVVENSQLHQHQVVVKRGGRDFVLTINGNPRAAQALNGQTNPDNDSKGAFGSILKSVEKFDRWLSANYTTRNPNFVISNFIRDAQYSNSMVWVKERPNYALRFNKNFMKVNPVMMKILFVKHRKGTLDMSNKMEAMFAQFMKNGGETGYSNIRDIEAHKKNILKELQQLNAKVPVGKTLSELVDKFDEYNRAVENCARFAAFMTSREFGRSIDRAIWDAKEISVNFNKKGSGDKFLGATGQTMAGNVAAWVSGAGRGTQVFWNAAIQGTTNFGRQAMRHHAKSLTAMASLFLLGVVMPFIGAGDGDDDDKNGYYDQPEYTRRSNIMFKVGDMWAAIPLSVEYRAIYGLGELMASVMSGKEHLTGGELAMAIASQMSQVMPIDMLEGGGGLMNLVPSAIKPAVEAFSNKSWTGLPIYKDTPYNKEMPEWTKAYKNANKHIVNLAKVTNELTGGDEYTKGRIDINPAQVEYLLNGYFSGIYSTIDEMVKMGETFAGEREFDTRSFLLLNRVLKNGDERTEYRAINKEYMRAKHEYETLKTRLKKYESDTENDVADYSKKIDKIMFLNGKMPDGFMEMADSIAFLNYSPEYQRYLIFDGYRSKIDALYRELKEVVDDEERKVIEVWINMLKKECVEELNATRTKKSVNRND